MSTRDFVGDPFLGGLIKKGLGAIGGAIKGALGFPSHQPQVIAPSFPTVPVMPGGTRLGGGTIRKVPGIKGAIQRTLPGGATGFEVVRPRRKRINPANPKALRRAIRRQQGFVKLARRALKGTGYTITSRSSSRRRRDLGPGHTHVR